MAMKKVLNIKLRRLKYFTEIVLHNCLKDKIVFKDTYEYWFHI